MDFHIEQEAAAMMPQPPGAFDKRMTCLVTYVYAFWVYLSIYYKFSPSISTSILMLLTIKEKQPLYCFQRKRLPIGMKVLSFRYNNSCFFCTSHKALERITPLITDSKLLTICCFYQIVCIHEVTSQKVLA